MRTSESIEKISAALAKAQGEMTNPPKNREVEVAMKNGGKYRFRYATLDGVLDVVRKPLATAGIALIQTVDHIAPTGVVVLRNVDTGEESHVPSGPTLWLTTRLMCAGEFVETSIPVIPESGGMQALGSAITYLRRYAITALLGLAAEEDDDANTQAGNTATQTERQPQGGNNGQGKAAGSTSAGSRNPTSSTAASAATGQVADSAPRTIKDENDRVAVDFQAITKLIGKPASTCVWNAYRDPERRTQRLVQIPILRKALETVMRVLGENAGLKNISETVDACGNDRMGPQAVRVLIEAFASQAEGVPYEIPTTERMAEIEEKTAALEAPERGRRS